MAAVMPAFIPTEQFHLNGGDRRQSVTKLCKPSVGLGANHHARSPCFMLRSRKGWQPVAELVQSYLSR